MSVRTANPGQSGTEAVVATQPKQPDVSVRFCEEPLDNQKLSFEEVKALHDAAWPEGLAPSDEMLRCMLRDDVIFGAFDAQDRLVAVLHARILEPGWSIGANDVAHGRRGMVGHLFSPPGIEQRAVVCHAAITHPSFRRGKVTQRLLTEYVLPYLERWDKTCRLSWYTSSPLTHAVDIGRLLVRNDKLWMGASICDHYVRTERPLGYASLHELFDAARPYLEAEGFGVGPLRQRGGDPGELFSLLFQTLPTHQELVEARHGMSDGRQQAAFWARRIQRLYLPRDNGHGYAVQNHRAAFMLLYLAVACTQAGVYEGLTSKGIDGATGHPIDPILRFHLANGGRLHPVAGPVPNSRTEDVSSLFFGQSLVYGTDWNEKRCRYHDLVVQRRNLCSKDMLYGPRVDWNEAEAYLRGVIRRLAKLAVERPAIPACLDA